MVVAVITFNVFTTIMLHKIDATSRNQRELEEARTERNLTTVTIAHSAIYIGFAVSVLMMIFPQTISLSSVIYTISSNLLTFVNPYFLLMASKRLRFKWIQFLTNQKRCAGGNKIYASSHQQSGGVKANPLASTATNNHIFPLKPS
uniref:G-protein coupled receptors family 1 profile domain-containing protein n=1 Tax=Plectus sambesii TaxID=2011161 RepID=A0A914WUP0_9BILA